jgi:hypothetical protein
MRAEGDPFLQAFTEAHGNRIEDKYYSFGTYRRGGRSSSTNGITEHSKLLRMRFTNMDAGGIALPARTCQLATMNLVLMIGLTLPFFVCENGCSVKGGWVSEIMERNVGGENWS